jgi:ribonuclease BN (tRNA processing enzyme)
VEGNASAMEEKKVSVEILTRYLKIRCVDYVKRKEMRMFVYGSKVDNNHRHKDANVTVNNDNNYINSSTIISGNINDGNNASVFPTVETCVTYELTVEEKSDFRRDSYARGMEYWDDYVSKKMRKWAVKNRLARDIEEERRDYFAHRYDDDS